MSSIVGFGPDDEAKGPRVPLPLTPEQIVSLKLKLDEFALESLAPNTNAYVVESELTPEGHYSCKVRATAKGYADSIACTVTFR